MRTCRGAVCRAKIVMMSYEFLPYRPEFKEQVLALQYGLWSREPTANAACFSWKYERNPYADGINFYLALSDGEVVGCRGFFGAAWQYGVDETPIKAVSGGDTVIVGAHQGRGRAIQRAGRWQRTSGHNPDAYLRVCRPGGNTINR